MALNSINSLIQKRGANYVKKMLENEVTIVEKLDTFRITFERKGDDILFYKKDNTPITLIERTLDDTWEQAIIEIPTLIGENKLPEGIRYGVAYSPTERPLRIPYTNLPKYVLTDITKKEGNKTIVYEYDEVTQWAGILCMGRPPVLFEGKLNEKQRDLLIDYGTKNYEGNYKSFSEFVEKVLESSYSKEDIIEGIVIKDNNSNIVQVISYEFEILNEAYIKNTNSSRDFYDVVMLSLTEFMETYKLPKITNESKEEIYIEIINDIFNGYCASQNIDENLEPKYLTAPRFGTRGKLNRKFITNEETLKLLDKDPIYEALYRVILSAFRKYKKPYGLLNESVIEKFNNYVGVINDIIKEEIEINDHADDYIGHLNEYGSENVTIKALKRRQPNDIDNMRVVSSIQTAFIPKERKIQQGAMKVAVYITEFQPFTSAQMTNVMTMSQQWNVPVVIAAVSNTGRVSGDKFHLSDGVVHAQMRALSNFNREKIPSFMLLDSWSLREVFERTRPHYEPLILFVDKDKKSEMAIQLYYEEEVMGSTIGVLPEFNIGEMENKDALSARRAIEDGNGSMFMEITPGSVHNFYDQIVNEYRRWAGETPYQIEPIKFPEIER